MIWFSDLYAVLRQPPHRLDTPSVSTLTGRGHIDLYIARCIPARAIRVSLFTNHIRSVAEWEVSFEFEGRQICLPVAAVGEGDWLRVYHSMLPVIERHRSRPAILDTDCHVWLPGTFGAYFKALDLGSVGDIVNTFNDDGYFRGATSAVPQYRGQAALYSMFHKILEYGGSPLELTTATIARGIGAFEYNCVPWCRVDAVPQAGLMLITEIGGYIFSVHIYDDVPESPDHMLDGSFGNRTLGLC